MNSLNVQKISQAVLALCAVAALIIFVIRMNDNKKSNCDCDSPKTEAYQGYKGEEVRDFGDEDEEVVGAPINGNTQFISSNLLPKNDPNMSLEFDEVVPDLDGKNFIDSYKYKLGAQSQVVRNGNLQLRADPPIARESVSPWLNSTIETEQRRPLDFGA